MEGGSWLSLGTGGSAASGPRTQVQAGFWHGARHSISAPLNCKRMPRNDEEELHSSSARPRGWHSRAGPAPHDTPAPAGMETAELCETLKSQSWCRTWSIPVNCATADPAEPPEHIPDPPAPAVSHRAQVGGSIPSALPLQPATQPLLILTPAAVEPPRSESHAGGTGKPPEGMERAAWQQLDEEVRATVLQRCPRCTPAAIPGHRHSLPDPHPAWKAAPAPGAQGHKARRDSQEDRGGSRAIPEDLHHGVPRAALS